ncbi:MAG: hypothetical protein M3T96_01435 [Acidobacteriota bacterium]|nr:hypothetical protein [Acidobacteriota bacterium]
MKKYFMFQAILLIAWVAIPIGVNAQRRPVKTAKVCGNPQIKCRTDASFFQPHELAFEIPKNNSVIVDSEFFYAIILKTVKLNSNTTCDNAISEDERLETQAVFPENKVFVLKCSGAGDIYYSNVADNVSFIAVYAGGNLTEANGFLKTVKANGKYKGANVRRMQAGINGT